MKKWIFLCLLSGLCCTIKSQLATLIPSSASIAQTSVADTHHWSGFNNPAQMAHCEHSEISFSYENRYIISQLSTKNIQAVWASKHLHTGFTFSHFGYSKYNEMMAGINFAKLFGEKMALAVQFNYYTAYFSASNSYRGQILPQIGFAFLFSKKFCLGFQTFNPLQNNIRTDITIKKIPSVFSLGTEYAVSTDFTWRTQIDKEISTDLRLATGMDYEILEKLTLKAGIYHSDYLIGCFGTDFHYQSFSFAVNCELHPLLGINSFASIHYRFK